MPEEQSKVIKPHIEKKQGKVVLIMERFSGFVNVHFLDFSNNTRSQVPGITQDLCHLCSSHDLPPEHMCPTLTPVMTSRI